MRARHYLFVAFLATGLASAASSRADVVIPPQGDHQAEGEHQPKDEGEHQPKDEGDHQPKDEGEHAENAREQRAVGGGADELGSAEGGREHPPGIINWWSWDYGASTKDPAHHGWPPPFGWALVNFAIFLFILSKILWKPLKAGFVERHETIKGELAEARRLHQEAEARLAEFQRKVGSADKEVADLLMQLRKDAEGDRTRLVAAAEAEAVRLKEDADRQIRVEIERARAELRRGAVEAAIAAAEEILKKGVTADDQRRLVERYVGDVEQVAPRTKGALS